MGKWTIDEENKALELVKLGKSYKEISKELNRTEGGIRSRLSKLGEVSSKYYKSESFETKKCICCGEDIRDYIRYNRKFCSHTCSSIPANVKKLAEDSKKYFRNK